MFLDPVLSTRVTPVINIIHLFIFQRQTSLWQPDAWHALNIIVISKAGFFLLKRRLELRPETRFCAKLELSLFSIAGYMNVYLSGINRNFIANSDAIAQK